VRQKYKKNNTKQQLRKKYFDPFFPNRLHNIPQKVQFSLKKMHNFGNSSKSDYFIRLLPNRRFGIILEGKWRKWIMD